jgi:hypothetical protein
MLSVVIMVTVVLATLIGWGWRGRWRTRTALVPPGAIPRETLALDAFMQGNAYLAEEKFCEATAAFHQARELDPKRAHVADRLAEVARRQHAVPATLPVTAHPRPSTGAPSEQASGPVANRAADIIERHAVA